MGPPLEDSGHDVLPRLGAPEGRIRYVEAPPPRRLAAVTATQWTTVATAGDGLELRIIPDGCVEIVQAPGGPALVFGPRRSSFTTRLEPGQTHWGIRLHPGVAGGLLRIDTASLGDRVECLADVVGGPGPERPADTVRLLGRLAECARPDALAIAAAGLLTGAPGTSVGDIARHLSIGERQLRRRFTAAVGLSPIAFFRIKRMERALAHAAERPACGWARIAHRHGFADQSHLVRELVTLTGLTPSQLDPLARGGRRTR